MKEKIGNRSVVQQVLSVLASSLSNKLLYILNFKQQTITNFTIFEMVPMPYGIENSILILHILLFLFIIY